MRQFFYRIFIPFFLFLFVSVHGFCSGDRLSGYEPPSDKVATELLSDIPELNMDNLRIFLPADNWPSYLKELSKGVFLHVNVPSYEGMKGLYYGGPFDFYKEMRKSKMPIFSLTGGKIDVNKKPICVWGSLISQKKSKNYIECGNYSCWPVSKSKDEMISNYLGLKQGFVTIESADRDYKKECEHGIEVFYESDRDSTGRVLSFKLVRRPLDNTFAQVMDKKGVVYLDISFCNASPSVCKIVDIKYSEFERAWMNLKHTQKEKDDATLNNLIQNLLPCVEKKDKKCVKSFFLTKKEAVEYANLDGDEFHPVTTIDNQLLKDLKTCLSYDKLLPYGARSLANDNRICIFHTELGKLYSVALPDSFKEIGGSVKVNYDK